MKKLVLFVFSLFLIQAVWGQTNIGQHVKVIKPYTPTVSEAFKISILPKINDTIQVKAFFDYLLNPLQQETGLTLKSIKPSEISKEPLSHLNNAYVKVGGGNYLTPMAELYINNLRSQKSSIGLKLKHISSHGKIKFDDDKKIFAGYSDSDISLFTKQFFNNFSTLSGDFSVKNNNMYYYGYDINRTPDSLKFTERDSISRRIYLLAQGDIQMKSNHKTKGLLDYNFLIHYHYMHNSANNYEHNARFTMAMDKYFDNKIFGINGGFSYYNKADVIDTLSYAVVNIDPYFGFDLDKFNLRFGVNSYFDRNVSTNHFYPRFDVQIKIVDYIAVYFGFDGQLETNSFKKVSYENPYVIDNLDVKSSNKKINAFGGVRTSFGSPVSFSFQTSYSEIDDMYFFVNNPFILNPRQDEFNVVYDNVKLLKVHGELGLKRFESLSFAVKANYYQYTMFNEAEPWHKPEYDASFVVDYLLKERFLLNADFFMIGRRYAKTDDPVNNKVKLDAIYDVNLGCEFYITKMFSAFVDLNNILGSKYFAWNNYPVQGFNVLGGVKYSF
ncbi:hypothetical protein ACFLSI_00490 [Bacteroidota bacterium]